MDNSDIEALEEYINYIEDRTANQLASSFGGLLFCKEAIEGCETLKKHIHLLSKIVDFSEIPSSSIINLNKELHQIIGEIKKFNSHNKNTTQSDEIQIKNFREYFKYERNNSFKERLPKLVSSISGVMLFHETDEAKTKNKATSLLNQAEVVFDKMKNLYDGIESEASKAGVATHARIFNTQCIINKKRAQSWKYWTIGLAFSLVGFASVMFCKYKDEATIQVGVFSGLIIAILFYATSLCVKSFFGEMHNYVINRHKANCLNTFKTLIETADEDNENVIVKIATETIFSHQTTGFLKRESGSSSPSPILEIIKGTSQAHG